MLTVGGLKAAAKRTAFGDVSNTARPITIVQEKAPFDGKHDGIQNTAPFHRPAQRPLNAAGLKSMLGTSALPTTSTAIPSKQPMVEAQQLQSQPIKRRNTLAKRTTAVFKDGNSHADTSSQAVSDHLVVPSHQSLGPRHHKSQPQLRTKGSAENPVQSTHLCPVDGAEKSRSTTAETIYQDAEEAQVDADCDKAYASYLKSINQEADQQAEEQRGDRQGAISLAPTHEPEEYWDEEEEEIYDDQGYTTAHSFRSRGDNTTGVATTILFPQVTSRVQKELAAAKEEVEMSRTTEDIEDEAWDTSMVAEYGEEIFQYMRELEVMLPRPSSNPCSRSLSD
jgi:G2/mitotic-specific cyclin 3/4